MTTKAGFIAILGQPNAGKSTLINRLVGTKVSIVSPKVQTTRRRVLGITVVDASQLIFVDTPGVFTPKKPLEKAMVKAAWESLQDADLIVVIVDAASKARQDAETILKALAPKQKRLILCLNKIDLIDKTRLLALASQLNELAPIEKTFMISALKKKGIQDLLQYCAQEVPENPWFFPEDQLSDLPSKLFAAEITREHIFRQLHQEIPYSLTVETEAWEQFKNGSLKISQVIVVERENQRAIVLGKQGQKIKSIGESARKELSFIFDTKVHLILHVKVDPKWLQQPERYRLMGLTLEP